MNIAQHFLQELGLSPQESLDFSSVLLNELKSIGHHRDLFQREQMLNVATPVSHTRARWVATRATNAYGRLRERYTRALVEAVRAYFEARSTAGNMAAAFHNLLRVFYHEAFMLGAQSSRNIKAARGFTAPLPEESRFLANAIAYEHGFLDKFLAQVVARGPKRDAAGKLIAPATYPMQQIQQRIQNYIESVDGIFEAGRVLAVDSKVTLIHWELKSKDPCPECRLMRDFSPYVKANLPTTPKAGETRCLMNCQCELRLETTTQNEVRLTAGLGYAKSYVLRMLERTRSRKR